MPIFVELSRPPRGQKILINADQIISIQSALRNSTSIVMSNGTKVSVRERPSTIIALLADNSSAVVSIVEQVAVDIIL